MLTQLSPTTGAALWASSLVVTGLGMGMAMQLPYTAIQVTLRYVEQRLYEQQF
jgi:hypothetical protein